MIYLKTHKQFRRKCPEHESPNTIKYLKYLKYQTDKKYVDLRLTSSRKEEIDKCHSFVVVPWYFSVKTRFFHNISSKIVRDIHYAYLNGKKHFTLSKTRYHEEDFKQLDDLGISYKIIKYRIFL